MQKVNGKNKFKSYLPLPKHSREISAAIRKFLPSTHEVYLFGSCAEGRAVERSDLDFGIDGPSPLPIETMITIRALVEGVPTLRKIDVVDLQKVGKEFRERALTFSKKI